MRGVAGGRIVAAVAALATAAGVAAQQRSAGHAAQGRIECAASPAPGDSVCSVDTAVYVGWRVFHAACAMCHAADARGSAFAPDLTHRVKFMDERAFFAALDNGYLGPASRSPPRGRDPAVAPYYAELWAYLAARASGRLPPGPLALLPAGERRPGP